MRSMLYIPANREDFIAKIPQLNADAITLDLEDSVPDEEKAKARLMAKEALRQISGIPVYIRVNSWHTWLTNQDLHEVVREGLCGICLPKCEEQEEIKCLDTRLSDFEEERKLAPNQIKIQLIIESARALMNVYKLAQSSARIDSLIFGVVDYTNDMRVSLIQPMGKEYEWARAMVACASVAVNAQPIDCPYMNIEDKEGFIKDTEYGKSLGYKGRLLIHPSQIAMANSIYLPTAQEIQWAKDIVQTFESEALARGRASITHNGKMVAIGVYHKAQSIIRNSQRYNNAVVA